jgi:myo-inositol-1(or 4)-monophosphatase
MHPTTQEIDELLRQVRDKLLPHYGNVAFEEKTKDTHDLVTKLDQETEIFLHEHLEKMYPDIVFVGEETGGDRSATKKWLCDPIDGTFHFIRGLPYCTTMLALIENGVVTMGFIYDFVNDVLYSAERGKGAFENGKPIHVSNRPMKHSMLSWENQKNTKENVSRCNRLRNASDSFKTLNAGHEFALVASGKIEGRITFDPYGKDYDFAPGTLLVEEAGGIVANLGSRKYDYTNLDFIAANPIMFKELTEGEDAIFPIEK